MSVAHIRTFGLVNAAIGLRARLQIKAAGFAHFNVRN
jgi:hypothetical protein